MLKSHVSHKEGDPKEDPNKAINEYIAMGLVRRFLIQYEPDFLKSHDIECKTIENGEGPQKKRSYDAII